MCVTSKKVILCLVLGVVQLGWAFVWMLIFALLGYDGGGFAGGTISPLTGVLIVALPMIITAMVWGVGRIGRDGTGPER